jgi:hypothetical protein
MLPNNLPGTGNTAVSEKSLDSVRSRVSPIVCSVLSTVSNLIKAQKAAKIVAVVRPGSTRMSRNDQLTTKVQQSSKPLAVLESLRKAEQNNVMRKLVDKANRHDHLVNAVEEDGTALVLLEMFKGDISRQAFVKRLLSSKEVKESDLLFPRAFEFDCLSDSSQSNIVHVMTAIAIGAAKKLLPKMLRMDQVLC